MLYARAGKGRRETVFIIDEREGKYLTGAGEGGR